MYICTEYMKECSLIKMFVELATNPRGAKNRIIGKNEVCVTSRLVAVEDVDHGEEVRVGEFLMLVLAEHLDGIDPATRGGINSVGGRRWKGSGECSAEFRDRSCHVLKGSSAVGRARASCGTS